jgi:hypothetical protein
MMRRRPGPLTGRLRIVPILAAGMLLAACGGEADPAPDVAGPAAPPGDRGAAPAQAEAANESAPQGSAAIVHILAGEGLEPGIAFGMARAEAVAAARAAFGTPTHTGRNDECGEGPMDFVSFGDLQLAFQDDRLAGWSLSGASPPLRTAGGLTVGSPRDALGEAEIDEESTLGPEFEVDGVGGILDRQGRAVEALWAGYTCQFR